ncbi:MAG: hypothetical protein ACT443_10205 [Gemmatimonadota bacterium]
MTRSLMAAAFAALLLTPATGFSQKEPERTKEIKDAEKFMASAMVSSDTADRKSRLERALNPLQQAMVKDPGNALVWFTAGQVYAALRELARADSAFDKAEQLHPALKTELENHRLSAWLQAASLAEAAMNEQKHDEATRQFELAEALYAGRPESKLNLGVLYAVAHKYDQSEAVYRAVVALAPPPAGSEDAAHWKRYAEIATIRIAQLVDRRGVEAFEARRFDEAGPAFRDAHQLNPHARDYAFNLAQTLYAKARDLEERRTTVLDEAGAARAKKNAASASAKTAQAKLMADSLVAYYTEIEPIIQKLRLADPTNEDLFILPMRSFRVRGDLAPDAAAKARYTERADQMFKLHQARTIELAGVAATSGGDNGKLSGTLRNLNLAPGTPVKIRFTLLSLAGDVVGQQEVAVNAPAADLTVPFEAETKVSGEVAAWKYEVVQ